MIEKKIELCEQERFSAVYQIANLNKPWKSVFKRLANRRKHEMSRKLPQNWISSYVNAITPITEAPDAYVYWSAISVVSAVLKKKVWIQR